MPTGRDNVRFRGKTENILSATKVTRLTKTGKFGLAFASPCVGKFPTNGLYGDPSIRRRQTTTPKQRQ
jgi:hypothetical protein